MSTRSLFREWIDVIRRKWGGVRECLLQRVEPQYQERYQVKITSPSDFDIEDVRERLEHALPDDDDIEVEVTRYFSVRQLDPRELETYYTTNHRYALSAPKSEAEATIEVRIGDDWETGAEVVRRASDQLRKFGRVSITGPDADIYEPLTKLKRLP